MLPTKLQFIVLRGFRADIDYAHYGANTQYGVIGIKVWIFKGEILDHKKGTLDEVARRGATLYEQTQFVLQSCDICRQLASQFHQSSPYDPLPSRGCGLSSFF
jgi:hypothetical protein